jgi:hypothetical protein
MNMSKTNFVVFQTSKNKLVSELKLIIGKKEINEVETTDFFRYWHWQ